MEWSWVLDVLPTVFALFDPGWWDRMRDSTTSGHFSPEATILTVGVFAVAGACIALGLFVSISFRRGDQAPSNWVVKPGQIRDLLDKAQTQRSKMRVGFMREEAGAHSTDATILSATPGRSIKLEMTALVRVTPSWVGKIVACDFRLRPNPRKNYDVFYAFAVPILHIGKADDNFIHIIVAWPSHLEVEQKRAFLRVEPPRGAVLELALWPEALIRVARGNFNTAGSWGDPLIRITAQDALPDAEVRNISAGGMRLDVQSDLIRRHQPQFEPGARFLVRLQLEVPADEPLTFYLGMRIQNSYGEAETLGRKAYGMRFVSYSLPAEDPLTALSWKTVPAGIAAIDEWVFRRHLEIYRARGDA